MRRRAPTADGAGLSFTNADCHSAAIGRASCMFGREKNGAILANSRSRQDARVWPWLCVGLEGTRITPRRVHSWANA
jgi:hypothetical protein